MPALTQQHARRSQPRSRRDSVGSMIDFIKAPAVVPPDSRVYAIGDVHGCLSSLAALHSAVADDLGHRPVATATLVHLGDYVDRGPDSAGVVRMLSEQPPPAGITTVVNLAGNHEDMMLAALADQNQAPLWLVNGGANTLLSWGIPITAPHPQWRASLAPREFQFLSALALFHRVGGYIFVHAGLRPGVPLVCQTRQDLLWIREPFLSSRTTFEGVVVHGHTPRVAPVVRPNRIGIDTGAVLGGCLTCAVLEADWVGFLTA